MAAASEQVHGSAVSIDRAGVLITGESGSGKSDLALRLIDEGAELIADDRVDLYAIDGNLLAGAPDTIAGLLEVRGVVIVELPHTNDIPVRLVIELVPPEDIERLAEPADIEVLGLALPLVRLNPFEASAPAKVRIALKLATGDIGSRS
ncbi:MAG: serine/threonine protein kinase [Rhodospirillaceae bacterium]|jgi:HPr kinase/phosphorylase